MTTQKTIQKATDAEPVSADVPRFAAVHRPAIGASIGLVACGILVLIAAEFIRAVPADPVVAAALEATVRAPRPELVQQRDARLDILTEPSGADIFIDGAWVGISPLRSAAVYSESVLIMAHDPRSNRSVERKLSIAPTVRRGRVELALTPTDSPGEALDP